MSRWSATRLALAGLLTAAFAAPTNASDPCVAPMPHTPAKPFLTVAFTVNFDFEETLVPATPKACPVQTVPPCCAFDRCEKIFVVAPMPHTAVPRPSTPDFQTARLTCADCGVLVAVNPNTGSLPTTEGEAGGFNVAGNPNVPGSYYSSFEFTMGSNRNIGDQIHDANRAQIALPPSLAIQRCEGVLRQPALSPCQHVNTACAAPVKSADMRVMYPLVGVTAVRRDENGTWWAEVQGIPQPKLSAPVTASNSCLVSGPVADVRQASAAQAAPVCCVKAGEFSGTWYRDMGDIAVAYTFTGNEMKIRMLKNEDGTVHSITVLTECSVTKDGLVHGVVTGCDIDAKRAENLPELVDSLDLIDCPFSFRVKSTSLGMMVSNWRLGKFHKATEEELACLNGMFKATKDSTVPTPKATKEQSKGSVLTLPSGRYLERHYPQYFSPDPDFPLQRELASQEDVVAPSKRVVPAPTPPALPVPRLDGTYSVAGKPAACQPAQPANVPAEAFDVMSGVFGEMLNGKPMPCQVQATGYTVPLTPSTVVAPPCPLPTVAKACVTGTWVREIGPIVYVVKLAPDHVTITATSSVEGSGGRTYTEGIVLTADYHMARDGTTLVGLITSVDAVIEGTMPTDSDMPPVNGGDELSRIQKLLVDKPLAFNVRHYGDVMAIGNVRLPDLEGTRGPCYPLMVFGGRYSQNGDKPLPKPKAVKMYPREILPTPLTATPNTNYIPTPGIVPTSGTLPLLPTNVPNDLPLPSQSPLSIPNPWNPVGANSTPLTPIEITAASTTTVTATKVNLLPAEAAVAPSPREVTKPRKKGKKPVSPLPLKEARS